MKKTFTEQKESLMRGEPLTEVEANLIVRLRTMSKTISRLGDDSKFTESVLQLLAGADAVYSLKYKDLEIEYEKYKNQISESYKNIYSFYQAELLNSLRSVERIQKQIHENRIKGVESYFRVAKYALSTDNPPITISSEIDDLPSSQSNLLNWLNEGVNLTLSPDFDEYYLVRKEGSNYILRPQISNSNFEISLTEDALLTRITSIRVE